MAVPDSLAEFFLLFGRTQKIGSKIVPLAPLLKICDSFRILILLLVAEFYSSFNALIINIDVSLQSV